jgi:hypothetical protein
MEPQEIKLGSPVKFIDMPTIGEILSIAASEAVISVGPIRIGLLKK